MNGLVGPQPQPAPTLVLDSEARRESMGPGGAYSFVMTSPAAAISIGNLLSFAPWASDQQKWKDGMPTKRRKKTEDLPVLHPDAAGIDVGASELFVAVPANRDPEPVRSYPTFTRDLLELVDWLLKNVPGNAEMRPWIVRFTPAMRSSLKGFVLI